MEYIEYVKHVGGNHYVKKWVETTLKNYLDKNAENIEEIEHMIDYLASEDAPKRISKMSYEQVLNKTRVWDKKLQKLGAEIKETQKDIETILDFGDGFKVVRLIGENAYKREGYLMRHCVANYFGQDKVIFSLRDKNNLPHCTMEKDKQIKGKGNGDIHPKYIDYIVKFLQHIGMTVNDVEMEHLGYVNAEDYIDELSDEAKKHLYANKYFPKSKKRFFTDRDNRLIERLDVLRLFPLIEKTNTSIEVVWNISNLIYGTAKFIREKTKQVTEDNSQLAGGDYSQLAGGDDSILVASTDSKIKAGLGSVIVLANRNQNGDVIEFKAGIIDNKTLKPDTWYKLVKGEFVEDI